MSSFKNLVVELQNGTLCSHAQAPDMLIGVCDLTGCYCDDALTYRSGKAGHTCERYLPNLDTLPMATKREA